MWNMICIIMGRTRRTLRRTDEMVREKLLCESTESHSYGQQYSYTLSDDASRQVAGYEKSERGLGSATEMIPFQTQVQKLCKTDLKELEVAATIVFFRKLGDEWSTALEKTRQFKNLPAGTPFLERCQSLASEIVS